MKIALDLNGGDFSPEETLKAIPYAIKKGFLRQEEIAAVGTSDALSALRDRNFPGISYYESQEIVGMGDTAGIALKKRKSSISQGMRFLSDEKIHAFVTAGNTAATVAWATVTAGRVFRWVRPAIAVPLPNVLGPCILLDAGASPACTPEHLLFFALMGSIYCTNVFGIQAPKVGLINMGSESSKGSSESKTAYRLIEERQAHFGASFDFIGNIEGDEILKSDVNVAVTSGLVGNLLLKFGEGLIHQVQNKLGIIWKIAKWLDSFHNNTDYKSIGGAALLGINGLVIIAHGKSSHKAVAHALKTAKRLAELDVIYQIKSRLA